MIVFTIKEVAEIHGIYAKERNKEYYADCPFCGNKKNKFSYIVNKDGKRNMFHCWSCDSGGNALDLHILLTPKDYSGEDGRKKACRDIYLALENNIQFKNREFDFPEEEEIVVQKKSVEYSAKVYRNMLKLLTLKEKHRQNLKKRGLNDEIIDRHKFRSTPDFIENLKICEILSKKYDLEGVSGFYKNKNGKWMMNIVAEGYFCPAYDGVQLIGFQIRVDNPIDGNKYIWFSSAGKECGCSSGGPATILPGKGSLCVITEGLLKATIVYELLDGMVTVIGVPGILTYKAIGGYLSKNSFSLVVEAYDMDKALKTTDKKLLQKTERIKNAATKLRNFVSSFDISVQGVSWDADKDGFWKENYKGLDDYILIEKNRKKMVQFLRKKEESQRNLQAFFGQKAQ